MPALEVPVLNHKAVHLALRAQLLTLPSLPATRAWTNKRFQPVSGVEYVTESFAPAGGSRAGLADIGYDTDTGLYVITWFGIAGSGLDVSDNADAVLAVFPPRWSVTAADGTVVRMRREPKPYRGEQRAIDGGWSAITITIPWECDTNATT